MSVQVRNPKDRFSHIKVYSVCSLRKKTLKMILHQWREGRSSSLKSVSLLSFLIRCVFDDNLKTFFVKSS